MTRKGPLSGVTEQLGDQTPGVPGARAGLRLALPGLGADEEQPAVPDLRQGERVVEVGDAGGSGAVLKEARQEAGRLVVIRLREAF